MAYTTDLLTMADTAAARSHSPYSGMQQGCALLLSDGSVVPGSRVESASFSLLIPPLVNAFSTAAALARTDIVAVAASGTFGREDVAFLADTFAGAFTPASERLAIRRASDGLPDITSILPPFLDVAPEAGDELMMEAARDLADRAIVPHSEFPVAALLLLDDGRAVPGVNVEHSDWARVICAERNVLGTLMSYGLTGPRHLYLTCPRDAACSPCGACRQLLAELAPEASISMDRHSDDVERVTPLDLLPGFFAGTAIPARGEPRRHRSI